MNNSNSICVLIPTKNRRLLLERAILSVFSQTVKPEEVIIVNDGSTDDTKIYLDNLVKKYPNLIVIHREKSGGVNTARNQAMKISKSDWVMFLDDDDEFLPNAVFLAKEKIKEIPDDYYLFYFNTLTRKDDVEYEGGFKFSDKEKFYDPKYEEVMIKYGLNADCKPIFRKSLFNTNEYWFPEIVNGFESLIVKKMARDGKKIRYYKEVSTIMNLQTNFEHLSFSASAKNPKVFLNLNIQDIEDHFDFYQKHSDSLRGKYLQILKLAFRSHDIKNIFVYLYKYGYSFFRI